LDSVAVAIHDVTPARLDDCVAIRETLADSEANLAPVETMPRVAKLPLALVSRLVGGGAPS
jgi:hypothetical protein